MVGEVDVGIYEVKLMGVIVLVMGVEGDGMRCLMCEYCD